MVVKDSHNLIVESKTYIFFNSNIFIFVINRAVRKIFGSKREEVGGGWSRLYNEELHNVYALPSIIRVIKLRKL
jgi:hypothetical protein